jgi:hypothetical protein
MKKSLIALAVLACAAGVASAGQAPPTNINTFQGGALMITVTNLINAPAAQPAQLADRRLTRLTDLRFKPGGDGVMNLAVTDAAGGSSCIVAQAPPAHLGMAIMAAHSPPSDLSPVSI